MLKSILVVALVVAATSALGQELDPEEEGVWEAQKSYWHLLKIGDAKEWAGLIGEEHVLRDEVIGRTTSLLELTEPGTFEFTLTDVVARIDLPHAVVMYDFSWQARLHSGVRIGDRGRVIARWEHRPEGWKILSGGEAVAYGWEVGGE